jgi:hypothetical protein
MQFCKLRGLNRSFGYHPEKQGILCTGPDRREENFQPPSFEEYRVPQRRNRAGGFGGYGKIATFASG